MASQSATDPRGVVRGHCTVCSCFAYTRDESGGPKCSRCGHPPAKHAKKDAGATVSDSSSSQDATMRSSSPDLSAAPVVAARTPPTSSAPVLRHAWGRGVPSAPHNYSQRSRLCRIPNCSEESHFDPNTGVESPYCYNHQNAPHGHLPHAHSAANFEGHQAVGLPHSQSAPSMDDSFNSPSDDDSSGPFITDGGSGPFMSQLVSNFVSYFSPSSSTTWNQQPPQVVQTSPAPVSQLPDDQCCKLPGCNRPRYRDANKTHDYCGRTHAQKYMLLQQQRSGAQPPSNMQCKTPGCTLPRRGREDGTFHDYCSTWCRDGGGGSQSPLAAGEPCKFPGCTRPRYVDPANGRVHGYCSRTHASQAQVQAKVQGGTLSPQPHTIAAVAPGSPEFSQVQAHFTSTWKKGSCPQVDYILSVTNAKLESRWKIYRKKLQHTTVERYYHGTKLTCDVVNQLSACGSEHCGVCGIAQNGMDRRCIRKNINFQRFGHGFYLAPNSSKCHDYTQTNQPHGPNTHRAMLLCDVLPGNKYKLQKGDSNLTAPPPGYHCVYGQVGSALNYEEIVFYNPDSVMPRYVVLYQKDGVHKIAK